MSKVVPLRSQPKSEGQTWEKDGQHGFLWLHVPTGVYYVRSFKKGRKALFKSTGQKSKGKAKTKALDLLSKWAGGEDVNQKTFAEAAQWVLKHYSPTQRIGTQRLHQNYIPQVAGIIGDLPLDRIGPDALVTVLDHVKRVQRYSRYGVELRKRKTFGDFAKAINIVMRMAYNNRWTNHLVKLKSPDAPKETGRLLSRAEALKLWEHMNEDTRDQYTLSLECLMRLREAICAPWSEINLETGEWTLCADRVKTGSKSGRGRSFILSPHALERLRARKLRMGDSSQWLFPSPTHKDRPIWSTKTAWRSAKLKAGITGSCRWHDLRHTGLTWVILGDPDQTPEQNKLMTREPIQVSAYAGVSMKTIERVYLKKRAAQSASVAGAISILNFGCESVVKEKRVKGFGV